MQPYEIGPPSILLSHGDEQKLLDGESLMQAIVQDDGVSRRLVMVKDIHAPDYIITSRLLDLDAYPRMVKGCDKTSTYEMKEDETGKRTIKTRYEIHALHLHFTYFMEHTYDPAERCMVFHLDYDRRSDLDDSVGYWYVQPRGEEECRVYYSCVTKLRGWVPAPVYAVMTKQALSQATTWVEAESTKAWEIEKVRREAERKEPQGLEGMVRGLQERLAEMKMELPKAPPAFEQWMTHRRQEKRRRESRSKTWRWDDERSAGAKEVPMTPETEDVARSGARAARRVTARVAVNSAAAPPPHRRLAFATSKPRVREPLRALWRRLPPEDCLRGGSLRSATPASSAAPQRRD